VAYTARFAYKQEEIRVGRFRVRILGGQLGFDSEVNTELWEDTIGPWLRAHRAGRVTTSVHRELFFA